LTQKEAISAMVPGGRGVSWVHEAGGRRGHKVVLIRAKSLRPLEPSEAYKAVQRRVRGLDGQIRTS
jgi:hypothetical protein